MKTLQIKNGDLVVGRGGHASISGVAKLRQDLAGAVMEPFGTDRFHPRWGSLLERYVGGILDETNKQRVAAEAQRVVSNYIGVQQEQMLAAQTSGRKVTFSSAEVVEAVQSVEVRQTYDRLYVRVIVRTLSGETVPLVTSVGV